ncbi:MAG: DUF2298 domain-containing protein [Sphingomonadaceae bacterium]|nr:DUF2298 domain-containing protein [Sphingomonadaceae bacterium]
MTETTSKEQAGHTLSIKPLMILHGAFFLAFLFGFVPEVSREDPPYVVLLLVTFCLVVGVVESLILLAIWWLVRHRGLRDGRYIVLFGFAFAAALNATVLYYGYAPFFLTMRTPGQLLAFLGAGAIFFLLFERSQHDGPFLKFGVALAAMVLISIAVPALMVGPSAVAPRANQLAKWSAVRFEQRPNVHLISFDSMIPQSLAEKFLNVSNLPYVDAIHRAGNNRIIPNSFVARQGSWSVLNSVVTLDDKENFPGDEYLNGIKAGSLYEVFKANGYKIATGYAGIYFGKHGQYLDQYDYQDGLSAYRVALCKFQARLAFGWQVGHFGFCEFLRQRDVRRQRDVGLDDLWLNWPRLVEEAMPKRNEAPQLTLHYIYTPIGHTDANHRTGDQTLFASYRDRFTEGAARAGEVVYSIIERVRKDDPQSVIYIFGDHGTWLSRTISYDENPEFFVQDRYGVFAALPKTANKCSSPDLTVYAKTYNTVGRTIASIIRCLAERPSEVDLAVNFIDDYDFSSFSYESIQ